MLPPTSHQNLQALKEVSSQRQQLGGDKWYMDS